MCKFAPRVVTLIFSIYKGWADFLGVKLINFNILGGLCKNDYFGGWRLFVDIFWRSLLILMGYFLNQLL